MTTAAPPMSVPRTSVGLHVLGLTVDQYDCLIDQGQIAEGAPIELLDGQMVLKDRSHAGESPMSVGELHAWVVTQVGKLAIDLHGRGASVRCQQPIVIPPAHEPEPDGAIVRERADDYVGAHPRPGDVLCVIEASDSSLATDRTTKLRVYADAGLPVYVIVNIPDRVLERHADPMPGTGTYRTVEVVHPGEVLRLPLAVGQGIDVAADRLIPPA